MNDFQTIMRKDNAEYWRQKINKNKTRDKIVAKTLEGKKWKVVRIWECELEKNVLPRKLNFIRPANKSFNRTGKNLAG